MDLNDRTRLKILGCVLLAGFGLLGAADAVAQTIATAFGKQPETHFQESPLAAYSDEITESKKDNFAFIDSSEHVDQIVLEFRSIQVRAEQMDQVTSLMIPGTFQSFRNPLPAAQPIATDAAESAQSTQSQFERTSEDIESVTLVSATESITQSFPTYIGSLDGAGLTGLIQLVTENGNSNIKRRSKVVIFSGHAATIADTALRPFVVDVKTIQADFVDAPQPKHHQPIIQCVEDGTILKVRATSQAGKIRLDGDLAISEIVSVGTCDLADQSIDDVSGVTVQVPGHKLKQIHWSTTLTDGHTLLIDPQSRQTLTEQKHKFSKKKPIELRTVYLLTAQRIAQKNVSQVHK